MISQIRSFISRLLPKSDFARGVSVLVGGTASAQILLVLAAPLLTRLYTPEDFGLLAVYASLLALIGVVSSLRYELAIPLPDDDQEAANVAVLCLILVAVSTLLTGILVVLLRESIARALGVPHLAKYIWLLPVGVLFSGVFTVFNYWGIRTKRFATIAATKLRQAVATLTIQLTAFKLGGVMLLFGQVAGQSIGTASLAAPALVKTEFKNVSRAGVKKAAIRYRRFPIFSSWAGLVNTAGHQLPILILAAVFTAGSAGLYSLAHRILTLPASLIGNAIADVFFSHAADAHREGRIGEMYLRLQDALIQIGLPPALILIVAGPNLFALIFSEAWRDAGVLAQWLALGVFAGFVVSPLSQVFTILERQKAGLLLQIILFCARCVGVAIGAWLESLILAVALFSIASVFGYALYIFLGAKYAGCRFINAISSLGKGAAFSLLLVTPLLVANSFNEPWVFYGALFLTAMATAARLVFVLRGARF